MGALFKRNCVVPVTFSDMLYWQQLVLKQRKSLYAYDCTLCAVGEKTRWTFGPPPPPRFQNGSAIADLVYM